MVDLHILYKFNYVTFQTEVENPYIYKQRVLLLPRLTQTDNIYGRYLEGKLLKRFILVMLIMMIMMMLMVMVTMMMLIMITLVRISIITVTWLRDYLQ